MFCIAVAGLLLVGVMLTQFGAKPPAPRAAGEVRLPAAPLVPPPTVEAPPPPSTPAPSAGASSKQRPPAQAARTTAGRKPTPKPAASLRIGAPVSLELAAAPGYRVRHRDFLGRTDLIGPASSDLARADARFVVRQGLARSDCISFESGNYPGRFLRHRDFVIRLDPVDRSPLFREDATFCPVRSRAGVVALRSHNYPDRFLTEDRSRLVLSPATTGTATQFAVRPPL